jgi:dihydroorotate dehydrogenase
VAKTSGKKVCLVLKIALDLDELAIQELAEVVRTSSVDGVIVRNTTITRPEGLLSGQLHSL